MNEESKVTFWDEVQRTSWPEMAGLEQDQLGALLTSQTFKHALGIVWEEAKGTATSILGINLATPAGISQAAQLQGKALGMTRVIEALLDLVEDEEKDEDDA